MVRKRFSLFGVVVLAFALLLPCNAFAVDFMPKGVFYQTELDGGNYGAVVAAYNQYDAACYVLGKNPDSISASIKTKLSDPDYGGRFYDYAQSFFTQSGTLEDVPGWVPTYIVLGSELGDLVLSDYQSVWYSTSTKSLHDDALTDLLRVLAGEDLSGGGSGGVVDGIPSGDYYELTLSSNYYPFPSSYYPHVIYLSVDLYNMWLNDSHTAGRNLYFFARSNVGASNPVKGFSVGFWWCRSMWADGGTYRLLRWTGGVENYWTDDVVRMYVNDKLFCYSYPRTDSFSNWVTLPDSTNSSQNYGTAYMIYKFEPSDWPIVHYGNPDGDWPEPGTPVTPDPPEQPTPTAPTVTPDNDPTEPVVTWPTSPTVVLPTQPTPDTTPSGLDYTELLMMINDNLISIDDYLQALNSSFNSFRSDFLTAVDSIVDSIRNIYSYLGHLNDILEVHCKHIRDQIEDSVYDLELYLMELFEWLPRQLNFDAQFTYDDTYVTMLLRRILNKIPGSNGVPTTYKPNPQGDEPGFFDWLLDLWHRFLIDLVSVLPDSLGGLVDTFSQLTHYFPFSIPWDVFALLSLFAHDPVTPVFDIPWGYGGGDGEVQLIHIDLSVWNDMMATVRPVFLVGFCIRLALITKEMLSNFDINKGGV